MQYFGQVSNQIAKAKGYDNFFEMDMAENPSDWVDWNDSLIGKGLNEFGSAIKNWWYKNTGRSHLTDEYQYEQKLADTAYQRAAADMEAAGLSKFGGVGSASSPSPQSGQGLLATALMKQQLKSEKLSFDQQKYDFKKAKQWGVPTGSVGEFAKYDGIAKLITGKSISELINNEGGLIGWINDLFGDALEGVPVLGNIFKGVKTDETAAAVKSLPVDMVADQFAGPGSDSYRLGYWFGDSLAAMTNNFTSNIKGNALRSLMSSFRNSLMQRGMDIIEASNTVNSVVLQYMGHYKGIDNYLYITKSEIPSGGSSLSVGSGYAGGGGHAI